MNPLKKIIRLVNDHDAADKVMFEIPYMDGDFCYQINNYYMKDKH